MSDRLIARRVYAAVAAPWLVIGYIGPRPFLIGCAIAGALVIGVAGWLHDGDHVRIDRD